jgi:hypothetical protein
MDFATPLKTGLKKGFSVTLAIMKVVIPCYIIIEFIKHTGIIDIIGRIFKPFMGIFGLPGEAALPLIAGYVVNLYAAIAILTPLGLPAKEITIIALMLGISHSLTVETPITRQTGVNAWLLTLVRIVVSLASGVGLNLVWTLFS